MGVGQSSPNPNSQAKRPGQDVPIVVTADSPGKTMTQDPSKIQELTHLMTAAKERSTRDSRQTHDDLRDNMKLLKYMFKKMDPSIMKFSSQATYGELKLSMKYDATKELLMVKVMRARDLDAKDLRGKAADPYVKLFIHPSSGATEVKMTRTVKETLNPTYHEIFAFSILDSQLQEGRLVAQVWDHDTFTKDDFIGEAIIPLSGVDFQAEGMHTDWYMLKGETDLGIEGDVEISLGYRLPDTLVITLHRGNNLGSSHSDRKPSPFVKVQVPGVKGTYETEVKYDTRNAVWEKSFDITVPPEEFPMRYLILHVIDYDDGGNNESLGQAIVELANFDPDKGYHGSFELADLKNSDRLRSKAFQDRVQQEFREALVAHAAFRYPKMIFQEHTQGVTKVLRVRNNKAGSEVKLRMVDGIPVY